ncbi:hypothetical protein LGM43_36785 [Burkholderia seminalis]|uniref:hypothetical protein n=1 Tax=Burkholderia seminalis TaxID=488731 RepID=UPI001CF59AC1|nr:hypothetical protein [Burkholderia seminalis]MCA7955786.1 hypothetical protein [Burkholderia seminalis]
MINRLPLRAPSRRTLGKDMLLPMPKVNVDSVMIEVHLALSALCAGKGTMELKDRMTVAVYMTYFLRDATPDPDNLDRYFEAEAALVRCTARGNAGQSWSLPKEDAVAMREIVVLYDTLTSTLPLFRLAQAWKRLEKFASDGRPSPLPAKKPGA